MKHLREDKKVIFYGDHIWGPLFGPYLDNETYIPSYNVRDLDTNDKGVHKDLIQFLKNQTANPHERYFDLFVTHLLGIDHAGHTFYANHSEIERKIIETDEILEDIVKNLDNDTVLLVYGDHGMTNDGNHGGGSDNELKTVLFGYSKGGFPMLH